MTEFSFGTPFVLYTIFITMSKISWRPGTQIYPVPAVLVTCGNEPQNWNMLTVAWTGTICSDPALCYISVRPERASYPLIVDNNEFTINLTTEKMARATDWAGVRSGRNYNKWKKTGLTPLPGEKVASPTILESPLSIECKVKDIIHLGSHDMFISEVVNVRADSSYMDEAGKFNLEKAGLIAYVHGHYIALGEILGKFGFSVKKK